MNRLLYFTGFRMVAQEWNGSKLKTSVYFEPDEKGFEAFKTYLSSIKKDPIRLVIDIIEEEFRTLTIPQVGARDRKSLINRNLEKLFRFSRFNYGYRQSIVKKEKLKFENLILSGVTNPSLLEPWLEIVNDLKMPLAGIVSLPLISEHYVNSLESDDECVILVSQQVPSNIRQSVFIKGKLVLSRLVPISTFYEGDYSDDVTRDIESTQRYLVSQKLIDSNDKITIHILANNRHINELFIACVQSNQYHFKIHNINDVLTAKKINFEEEQEFSSPLFCYEASQISFIDHYSRKEDKKYFQHFLFGLGLKAAGVGLFAIGLGMGISNVIQGDLYHENIQSMNNLTKRYNQQYEERSKAVDISPVSPTELMQAVEISRVIDLNYDHKPNQMLTHISEDLKLFADLRVTSFEWFISDRQDRMERGKVVWGQPKNNNRRRNRNEKRDDYNGHYEIAIFKGEFLDFNGDYRYALSVLEDLDVLLSETGKYDVVEILERPLNTSEDSSLQGSAKEEKEDKYSSEFRVKVVVKVPLNA